MSSRRGFFRHLASSAAQAAREVAQPAAGEEDAGFPLTDAELERYARQLVLPEWGLAAQLEVGRARVLVVGAGALGSPVAMYLVAAGVGRIGIVDGDAVELSNLHRQLIHTTHDIGVPKAESAATALRSRNPDVLVETYPARFEPGNGDALVEGHDLVVDCTDRFETRYAVNAACCAARVPLVEAGVSAFAGMVMAVRPGESACYRCVFPSAPADAASCAEAGVLGPAAGVIGSLQALEALRLLGGVKGGLVDGFLQVDLLEHAYVRVRTSRRADCPDCGAL